MTQDEITERNVAQLDFTAKALNRMQRGRPPEEKPSLSQLKLGELHNATLQDMLHNIMQSDANLRNELRDAKNLVEGLQEDMLKLEQDLIECRNQLEAERTRCAHFETLLTKVARMIVDGTTPKDHSE